MNILSQIKRIERNISEFFFYYNIVYLYFYLLCMKRKRIIREDKIEDEFSHCNINKIVYAKKEKLESFKVLSSLIV